ncbi:chorismate mutase [Pseudofrankia sp. BMG5.36]|uniref:chorismate mutase n=1 Tax=Pseudofrankia sp. BMG5.36 TaxID=1834512 RepID=UPI0009F737B2|nr:chorismate mutase [Pseudofrankia sp. BMG5.36]
MTKVDAPRARWDRGAWGVLLIISLLSGRLVERFGPRTPARGGAALAGVAVLAATVLGADGPALIPTLAAAGAGVGLAMPALVATAVGAAPAERIGLASGLNNTARQVGGALGVALLGGIVAGSHSVAAGTRVGLAVAAAAYLLAALVCGALPGRPGRDRQSRTTTKETHHALEDRPHLLSGRAAVTAGELDARPHPTPSRSRLTGLDLLGPEAPDISMIDSVTEGREIIDELDDLIRDVIVLRRRVAWQIQKLRMTAGGGRIEMSREYEVTRRFLDALGPAGSDVAVALLLLCRGPAPSVDVRPSTEHDIDAGHATR